MQTKSFDEVADAIKQELAKQDAKWGSDKPQSLPGYLILIRKELEEAELGWCKDLQGKHSPLSELVQVAALAVRALQAYGVSGSAVATNDIPDQR